MQGSASSTGQAPKAALILSAALLISVLLVSMLLVSMPLANADQVYKSADAQGHVVYSDRATTPTAQKSEVHVIQPDADDAARAAKETSILQAEEGQRKRLEAQQNREKSQQDQEKQRLCEMARNRYNSIKDANLLYKLDAQGNREFYTDAEADARKEQARKAMVSACGK